MIIVPNTENWNNGEMDWSYVPDPTDELRAWELKTGQIIPCDYKMFLTRYNGGSVYPRIFSHNISTDLLPSATPEEYVDRFYRWDQVHSLFDGLSYGRGIPKGHLNIAETPGPLEILIGIEGADFGKIFAWIRSSDSWGAGRNQEIYPLAVNFKAFLGVLYDDDAKSDYASWFIPAFAALKRELIV